MPLYDFKCRACGHQFETLVRAANVPQCPNCHGQDLEQQPSSFAVSSVERTKAAVQSARKGMKKARRDQIEYEREMQRHDD